MVVETAISEIIEERYKNPADFEAFTADLIALGVARFTCDTLCNQMHFYSQDAYICTVEREDLIAAQADGEWPLGKSLDSVRIENAIHTLDSGKISCEEFHKEIHAAGVILCSVYLHQRKIFYMGVDAKYYLESY